MIKLYITAESAEAAMNELREWIGSTATGMEKMQENAGETAKRKRGTTRRGWQKWSEGDDNRLRDYMELGYSSKELDGSFPGRSVEAIANRMTLLRKRMESLK